MLAIQQAMTEEAMGFVNERIPEEDKEQFGIEKERYWQIDREREAIFFYTTGDIYSGQKLFKLLWKGRTFDIRSDKISLGTTKETLNDIWRNTTLHSEKRLSAEEQEIVRKLISDALTAYSQHYFPEKEVTVEFSPNMNPSRGV